MGREIEMTHQIVKLARDCSATEIPRGDVHILAAGTPLVITQQLGGSYTVTTGYGQLMRIDAKDADALGFAQSPSETPTEFSEQLVWDQLRTIYDPEIPVNIVDLGLVYSCEIIEGDGVHDIQIAMTMTAPGCGMSQVLKSDVEQKLSSLPTVNLVRVEIVFDPPWTMQRMSEATRLQLGLDY
jgi:probable FeS assembly SUF system protein SufT